MLYLLDQLSSVAQPYHIMYIVYKKLLQPPMNNIIYFSSEVKLGVQKRSGAPITRICWWNLPPPIFNLLPTPW